MPTVSARVPKYCLLKSRGLAYVRIRGEVRYLGKFNSPDSLAAYRQIVLDIRADAALTAANLSPPEAPPPVASGELTVIELCAAFLEYAKARYVKNGRSSGGMGKVRRALRLLRQLYGQTRAVNFGPRALKTVQKMMLENPGLDRHTGKPLRYSRSTINATCKCITRIFGWATEEELLPGSVWHSLKAVRGLEKGRSTAREPKRVRPVSEAAVSATLPHLPPIVADMVRFQRVTGARPGEVCDLRPIDVDRSSEVWEYRPESFKTEHHEDEQRVVFIGPKAQAVLLPYFWERTGAEPTPERPRPQRPADAYCFSPAESEALRRAELRAQRKTRVKPWEHRCDKPKTKRTVAKRYSRDSYRRAIAKAIAKANQKFQEEAAAAGTEARIIPNWYPNQLRHSAATEIRREHGLEAAQVILGHSKADVTQVYAERNCALAREVVAKIG